MKQISMVTTVALVVLLARTANAQPGQTPSQPPQPTQSGWGAPPPAHTVQLTPEEQQLLEQGEITPGQHIGGVLLGLWVWLGSGQAVQGRWHDTGWIFTFGELAAGALFIYEFIDCIGDSIDTTEDVCNDGIIVGSFLALVALRGWEVIDAIVGPNGHNEKVRAARWKMQQGGYGGAPTWSLYGAPAKGGGAVAGLTLRF